MKIESALGSLHQLDDLAAGGTVIHRLHPLSKLLVTVVFLGAVASCGRYSTIGLLPFLLYPAVLIGLGGLPIAGILRRVFLILPLAFFMGVFNPVFDRAPMAVFGMTVAGGWVSFASILIRFLLSMAAGVILVSTTGFAAVCSALSLLRLPRVFVEQLMFMYRYLFVLAEEITRLGIAFTLRAGGRQRPGIRVYASLTGQLLLRTLDRAQRIHQAMTCRGYDGRIITSPPRRMRAADLVYLLGWTGFFILARLYNLPELLGRLCTG